MAYLKSILLVSLSSFYIAINLGNANAEERLIAESVTNNLIEYSNNLLKIHLTETSLSSDLAKSFILKIETGQNARFTHFLLGSPNRLVIDIADLNLDKGTQLIPPSNKLVKNFRIGVHEKMVRLVVDLATDALPEVTMESSNNLVHYRFNLNGKGVAADQETIAAVLKTVTELSKATDTTEHITSENADEEKLDLQVSARRILNTQKSVDALKLESSSESLIIDQSSTYITSPEIPDERLAVPIKDSLPSYDFGNIPISIDKVWINFLDGERPIQDIRIKNRGDNTITLISDVQLITNPGQSTESVKYSDGLSISPRNISINAGEEKTVRLLLKDHSVEQEVNYRVVFAEKLDLKEPSSVTLSNAKRAAIAISVSVLPSEVESGIDWKVEGSKLVLENRGNISVYLDSGVLCESIGSPCDALPSRRLYPGNSWAIEVAGKRQAEFVQRLREESQQLIIPLTVTVTMPSAA